MLIGCPPKLDCRSELPRREIREIISALLLQRNVYERIAHDATGTLRASGIVLFVALVHGACDGRE